MANKDEKPCVSREGKTDEQYIVALERSNRSLRSENRRIVKRLIKLIKTT